MTRPTLAALALTGCATVMHGKTDPLILTAPDPATVWEVNGQPIGTGSTVRYDLPTKGNRGATIMATVGQCADIAVVDTRFDPLTLAGILVDGGIVSVLVVDGLVTGAWTRAARLDYRLEPECRP